MENIQVSYKLYYLSWVKFQFKILSFDCLNLIFDFGFVSIDFGFVSIDTLHLINVWSKTVVLID